jgi:hypothetical protein
MLTKEDNLKNYDIVLCSKGDYLFKNKKYDEAADIYSKTTKSFEQICIQFYNANQKDSLRSYLLKILKKLHSHIKKEESSIQLSCLCTWLVEIFLDKINLLIEENSGNEKIEDMKKQFKKFLEENKKYLNVEITLRLISSHGIFNY